MAKCEDIICQIETRFGQALEKVPGFHTFGVEKRRGEPFLVFYAKPEADIFSFFTQVSQIIPREFLPRLIRRCERVA